ncbi:hypothetical protein [Caloranaerobacter sp. DY30410]|uniref:hypothetical protein n=1 Tax=Caloranaerobacter sp. DY30410 TaxID=3238305 RepID=UPI003D01F318
MLQLTPLQLLIGGSILVLITIAVVKLIPYIKDFKITSEEKAKVQEILIDAAKSILEVASSKDKKQLVLAITNITMRKLEQENIKGFRRKDIELMTNIVVDKLEDYVIKN